MSGRWIDIGHDGLKGFLAVPDVGSGPGLLMLCDVVGVDAQFEALVQNYAEEGYVVLAPALFWKAAEPCVGHGCCNMHDVAVALACLTSRSECSGEVGALGFGAGGRLALFAAAQLDLEVAIAWTPRSVEAVLDQADAVSCPVQVHMGEDDQNSAYEMLRDAFDGVSDAEILVYPGLTGQFADPASPTFDKAAALMAYSRAIALLRRTLGPRYDLAALWEQHTDQEFRFRDAGATMKTMVAQPYVNHIPTMTGGVGHDDLLRFYREHFIPKTPADTRLIPVSRTVGADRLVDEMLFCFTHDIEIDWMLPGIPPTGCYVEIPLVAIVRFRGDKLYNEHIYWDQASVLVQIGLLDPTGLPVAGVETARKLLDEDLPSNTLMHHWEQGS